MSTENNKNMAATGTNIIATESSAVDFTKQTWKEDVTFVIEDRRLYASRSILALLSPVFESMFGSDFKEKKQDEVALPGKKVEDFLDFLHCIYPTSSGSVTRENVFQVLPLADEYQIRSLLIKCKEVLVKLLSDTEEETTSIAIDLVKCYLLAARHNLTDVAHMCIANFVNIKRIEAISSEAEKVMDKDTLLKFKSDIINEQAKKMNAVTTQLVRLALKQHDIKTKGFGNAIGIVVEHTLEHVFDPILKYTVCSRPVELWNARFILRLSVTDKESKGMKEKYLSAYLGCELPDDWECEVKAVLVLQNCFAVKNKNTTGISFSTVFDSETVTSYGCEHFEQLSNFLTRKSEDSENYTGKVTAYILANEPKKGQCGIP